MMAPALRCGCCGGRAVARAFGFLVCEYHLRHGENPPADPAEALCKTCGADLSGASHAKDCEERPEVAQVRTRAEAAARGILI